MLRTDGGQHCGRHPALDVDLTQPPTYADDVDVDLGVNMAQHPAWTNVKTLRDGVFSTCTVSMRTWGAGLSGVGGSAAGDALGTPDQGLGTLSSWVHGARGLWARHRRPGMSHAATADYDVVDVVALSMSTALPMPSAALAWSRSARTSAMADDPRCATTVVPVGCPASILATSTNARSKVAASSPLRTGI